MFSLSYLGKMALLVLLAPGVAVAESGQPFTVVLDAAHGGSDPGTVFSPSLSEKSWVLGLSMRLRSALQARGMRVVTTREGDTNPDPNTRAGEANHALAGACLVLHATTSGSGAHLYTSSLNRAAAPALVPWQTAQAPFITASLEFASEISTALNSAAIPVTLGRVRLAPMDSLRCPAVAVEFAPLLPIEDGKRASARIDDPAYDQRMVDALAAALVAWRGEQESHGVRP